jgi:hypothetical protein
MVNFGLAFSARGGNRLETLGILLLFWGGVPPEKEFDIIECYKAAPIRSESLDRKKKT